ncbi:MAG: TldD/PmbA family protein [Candidatus Bathyarchaeota archaeon]
MAEYEAVELIEFAKKAVDSALRSGADEAEAYVSTNNSTSIDIERGQIVRSAKNFDQGIGVRGIYKKSIGFSYTNILKLKNINEASLRAIKAAKASKPDKNWRNLPYNENFNVPKNTYDKSILSLSSDMLVKSTEDMLEATCGYDKRVLAVAGGITKSFFKTAIVNSHGIEESDLGTAVGCWMETIARDGSDVTPACYELNAERIYKINPIEVGLEASRLAVSALNPQKMESGSFPVIFTQAAFSSLLYYTVINAVKADYVQRERSAFKKKMGKQVASNIVTIHDDGLLDGGLLTGKFDGEGIPSQKTLVIEKGVLKNFLYDSYWANKIGTKSTGNASRSGGASYASTPTLEASNFVIKKGNKTTEDLVSEIDRGLLIYGVQGAHSSNPESSEFSVVATPVWKIEGGEIAYPTRDLMISGIFFDILKNISMLGNNVRKFGQLVSPWIRVDNVQVVGKT